MLWVKGELLTDVDAAGIDPTGQLERSAQSRLFDRREWFRRVLRYSGALPLIGRAASEGSLCWLFLQRNRRGAVTSLSNRWSFAFRPVFSGMPDRDRQRAMLVAISKRLRRVRPRIHSVSLSPVPESDDGASQLQDALNAAGWITFMLEISVNRTAQVHDLSFAEYWESRPAALRESIKNIPDKQEFETEILTHFNEEAWSHLEALHDRRSTTEGSTESFEKELAIAEGNAGKLRLGLCRINNTVVAAQFWTIENRVALIHATAQLEGDAAASGATVLTAAMFSQAIDEDRAETIECISHNQERLAAWLDQSAPLMRIEAYNLSSLAGRWSATKAWLSHRISH